MATSDFTIADVLAWARTKPADESYDYDSNENCALCQFLRETGRAAYPTAGGVTWTAWDGSPYSGSCVGGGELNQDLRRALHAGTFGGLAARLEKYAPETPVTPSNWLKIDAYLTDIEQVSA